MKVIEFLKEHGVEKLKEETAIIVKEYDEGLLVLNYDQINSPKAHPLVMECRSLILDTNFNIVSRSFDRFFNYGEAPDTQKHLDFSKAICYEKVDGSLIKIYCHKGKWHAATRGTAFAESEVNGWGISFKDLVLKALDCEDDVEFQMICNLWLDDEWTYIFEVTSAENRVVKKYDSYLLHYLASRHNATGEFGDDFEKEAATTLGAKVVKSFKFDSVQDCIETAKSLPDLEEGYVVYQDGVPVCKIKSPAYLAVHAIRGEGLTPKRIMQPVLMNEQDEYLTYFPEDTKYFIPYIGGLGTLLIDIEEAWKLHGHIEDQKEFALKVKDWSYSAIMFQTKREGGNPIKVFHDQRESYKIKLLEEWVNA